MYTLGSYMYIYVHTSKYIRLRVPVICDDGLPSAETRLARGSWPHPHTYTWPENGAVTAWKPKGKNLLSTFAADHIYLFDHLYIQAHAVRARIIYWHRSAQSQVMVVVRR